MTIDSLKLLRASGMANMVAGLLTAVFWFLHPGELSLSGPSVRWLFANLLFIVLLVLMLWGLTGLYVRQIGRTGIVALAGYLIGFAATASFVGLGAFAAFVKPVIAERAGALLGMEGPLMTGAFGSYGMVTGLSFALGYVLFGLGSLRSKLYPLWALLALVISVPVLGLSQMMPFEVRLIGCLVFGVANIALGWCNWSIQDARVAMHDHDEQSPMEEVGVADS